MSRFTVFQISLNCLLLGILLGFLLAPTKNGIHILSENTNPPPEMFHQ